MFNFFRIEVISCSVIFPILLSGCGSAMMPKPSPTSEVPPEQMNSQAPDLGIKVSTVTARGLASVGATDVKSIVTWFNQPSVDTDPFLEPMQSEIAEANSNAPTIESLKLSSVTVDALSSFGVNTPAGIASFPNKKLKDTQKPLELCRAEIAKSIKKLGWTELKATLTNKVNATQIMLNAEFVGSINPSDKLLRNFLVYAPGSVSDSRVIATLSVDLPNSKTGEPSVRWYKDLDFYRGGVTSVAIDVGSAPSPSIGFAPKTPLSPGAVYAGDTIALTVEGGGEDTVWFSFPNTRELNSGNYKPAPSDSQTSAGLPSWFRLRESAEQVASPRDNLLDEPFRRPIILGSGAKFQWHPEFETPSARICVLVRDSSGYWGFAERTISVADIRPGIWMMPNLLIDPITSQIEAFGRGAVDPTPPNIYLTHAILSKLTYLAKTKSLMTMDLRADEYRDASLPLTKTILDFGDKSPAVTLLGEAALDSQIKHTFQTAGTFKVTARTIDVMGFERKHETYIRVTDDAPVFTKPAVKTDMTLIKSVKRTAAMSSMELFRQTAALFSRMVVSNMDSAIGRRKVGLAHIHDFKNQEVIDIMDTALVEQLLDNGNEVYEREPIYQYAVEARGFVDAKKVVVPEQGGKVPDLFLTTVADGKDSDRALTMALLEKIGTVAPPDVDVVIAYKLKRAEVTLLPFGALTVRTAKIFGFVRVIDRKTLRILADKPVEAELGGTIVSAESTSVGTPWDSLPDGFMLRDDANDKAIQKEVVNQNPVPANSDPNVPAVPTTPAAEPGITGAIKGLFGG